MRVSLLCRLIHEISAKQYQHLPHSSTCIVAASFTQLELVLWNITRSSPDNARTRNKELEQRVRPTFTGYLVKDMG